MALINNYPYSDFENINLDWLIKIVKEYVEKTNKVEIDMAELKAYVDDYFANLDVQDEIDNKLQEMYDNGDLAILISQFLTTTSLLVFNTVADMVAAPNLADQVNAICLGYTAYTDGLTRIYKIRTMLNTDVIDGVHILALTNFPALIAEYLPSFENRHYYTERPTVLIHNQDEFTNFWKSFNEGYTSRNCRIVTAGTYALPTDNVNFPVLNSIQTHINVDQDNVVVDLKGMTFYTGHFVIEGLNTHRPRIIDTSNVAGRAPYCEGSTVFLTNCDLYCSFTLWSCYTVINTCDWYDYKADRNVCLDVIAGECSLTYTRFLITDFYNADDGLIGVGEGCDINFTGRNYVRPTVTPDTGYFLRTRQNKLFSLLSTSTWWDPDAMYTSSNRGSLKGFCSDTGGGKSFAYGHASITYMSQNSQTFTNCYNPTPGSVTIG